MFHSPHYMHNWNIKGFCLKGLYLLVILNGVVLAIGYLLDESIGVVESSFTQTLTRIQNLDEKGSVHC